MRGFSCHIPINTKWKVFLRPLLEAVKRRRFGNNSAIIIISKTFQLGEEVQPAQRQGRLYTCDVIDGHFGPEQTLDR
jgi:hypothetical protein